MLWLHTWLQSTITTLPLLLLLRPHITNYDNGNTSLVLKHMLYTSMRNAYLQRTIIDVPCYVTAQRQWWRQEMHNCTQTSPVMLCRSGSSDSRSEHALQEKGQRIGIRAFAKKSVLSSILPLSWHRLNSPAAVEPFAKHTTPSYNRRNVLSTQLRTIPIFTSYAAAPTLYIYIYIERERDAHTVIYIYIYVYMYTLCYNEIWYYII